MKILARLLLVLVLVCRLVFSSALLSGIVSKSEVDPASVVPTSPHGNSAMLVGKFEETVGRPTIPDISSIPRNIGPKAPAEYTHPYKKPMDIVNPNALLQDVVGRTEDNNNNNIKNTVHFSFDSKNKGSSVTSIPFLVDRADTTSFCSDFWVETMQDGSKQLQYSQTIDIAFHKPIGSGGGGEREMIQWPHITVNTLTKSK
jgi:hypothetical protein